MNTLVIASIFKNEAHILKEWIDHYIKWGVQHFYLVNDFSTDSFMDIIKEYNCITLFHNDIVTTASGRQPMIYNRYFKDIPSKWVSIIDLDEFIWSPEHADLKDTLDDTVSQIKIDWLHFGSSGHIIQPKSVVNNFTKRAKFDTSKEYYSYKSIYQTKDLVSFGVHGHTVKGKTVHYPYNDEKPSKLIINHYPLQSFDFFMTVKATRGDLNNYFDLTGRKRNEAYFKKQDINEIEDTRLMNLN